MPIVNLTNRADKIMRDTWGHLAAKPGQIYPGFVLFSVSPNGSTDLLDYDFKGLDGNPWTHENVAEWWNREMNRDLARPERLQRYSQGAVVRFWRWEGSYREFKNGSFGMSGKAKEMKLVPV